MKEIYTALLEAQKELYDIDIKKDAQVNFNKTKYEYCSLPKLLSIIVPVLNKHNIYLEHEFGQKNGKEVLVLVLTHTPTGQNTESMVYYSSEGKDDKAWGGGTTYKRRYMIMSKLGIFPDDDNSELIQTISRQQIDNAYSIIMKLNIPVSKVLALYKIKHIADMTDRDYKDFISKATQKARSGETNK